MGKLLIVYHSLGGNTKAAAESLASGAKEVKGTQVVIKEGLKANPDDLLKCDGVAFGTPDYFSYMAGGLKDFFDRTFYPTQGQVTDKPYAAFVTHGGGGKAQESVESICRSFKFKKIADTLLVKGKPDADAEKCLKELGRRLAQAVSS